MINDFIDKMKPDLSNIDEVYSELLIKANVNNIDFTELMFIDSFDFDKYKGVENLNLRLAKLSSYLDEKRKNIEWFELDYFNHYLQTKRFGFEFYKTFKQNEFNEVINLLELTQKRFYYIYKKLNFNQQLEFKSDFIDQLNKLLKLQSLTKFKVIISEVIKDLEPIDTNEVHSTNIISSKNIINLLSLQLQTLTNTIEKDLSKGFFIDKYFIKEIDAKFLDVDALKEYLATTKIENHSFLKDLIIKSEILLDLWNEKIINIPESKNIIEYPYYLSTKDGIAKWTTFFDFYAIRVLNNKLEYQNNEFDKKIFLEDFNYKKISLYDIAYYSMIIINYITSAYPELDNKIEADKPLNQTEITTNKNNSKENFNNQLNQIDSIHPKYNPNFWNNECYELFKYLFDNYYDDDKKHKRKLTNIWFFLKEDKNEKYLFDITQEQYIDFIKTNYNVQITNFVKAEFKYKEKEVIKYNEHRINFEKEYKKS